MKKIRVFRVDIVNEKEIKILPRIPKNKAHNENDKIKRVCCSNSINGCLSSVDSFYFDDIVYLYESEVDSNYIYQPSEQDVFDVDLTGELWILKPVVFKRIGRLEILGYIGSGFKSYVNNQYSFKFVHYSEYNGLNR